MRKEKKFIGVDGKNICIYDCGDQNKPAVLLGHSYLWSKHMWEPQLEALAKNFRLIIPDLWSHGESDELPENAHSLTGMAECYFKMMQQLNIATFSIIGLSVGGMWGAELALAHPEAVTGLVMMDTFIGSEPEKSQKEYLGLIKILRQVGFNKTIINVICPFFFSSKTPKTQPDIIKNFKHFLANIKKGSLKGIAEIGNIIFTRSNQLKKLTGLKMPVLIIVGKDDTARPPKEAHEMAMHAKCDVIEIEDGGHICNIEQPIAVSKHLDAFLTSLVEQPECSLMTK